MNGMTVRMVAPGITDRMVRWSLVLGVPLGGVYGMTLALRDPYVSDPAWLAFVLLLAVGEAAYLGVVLSTAIGYLLGRLARVYTRSYDRPMSDVAGYRLAANGACAVVVCLAALLRVYLLPAVGLAAVFPAGGWAVAFVVLMGGAAFACTNMAVRWVLAELAEESERSTGAVGAGRSGLGRTA